MSSILEELQLVKQASQEQTTASQAISQEVSGKMGEIESKLNSKMAEVDTYLINQSIRIIKIPSEYLLLGKISIGESIQFHGFLGLDNYTGPYHCVLSVIKNYTTNAIGCSLLRTYGTIGFSVCTVTLDGVQYLALRNDGEANRRWKFTGISNSSIDFLPVQTVDSVDEIHTLSALVL